MAFLRKSTKSPSLTRPYLLEDATQDNLPYPKELTIYSYRMTWHCYITLPTSPRPIVRYAYRYSIRRRSRLTVIILDLSKPKERLRRSFLANDDTKKQLCQLCCMVWQAGRFQAGQNKYGIMVVLIVDGRIHQFVTTDS